MKAWNRTQSDVICVTNTFLKKRGEAAIQKAKKAKKECDWFKKVLVKQSQNLQHYLFNW